MPRYAVTLHAPINITADNEAEAIRYCNEDAREFLVENDVLEVADVTEVDASTELTESLNDVEFQESEVQTEAEKGSVDWTMNGVYIVIVDAADAAAAGELAKTLPKRLAEAEALAAKGSDGETSTPSPG